MEPLRLRRSRLACEDWRWRRKAVIAQRRGPPLILPSFASIPTVLAAGNASIAPMRRIYLRFSDLPVSVESGRQEGYAMSAPQADNIADPNCRNGQETTDADLPPGPPHPRFCAPGFSPPPTFPAPRPPANNRLFPPGCPAPVIRSHPRK